MVTFTGNINFELRTGKNKEDGERRHHGLYKTRSKQLAWSPDTIKPDVVKDDYFIAGLLILKKMTRTMGFPAVLIAAWTKLLLK